MFLDNAIGFSSYGATASVNPTFKINAFKIRLQSAYARFGLGYKFNEDYEGIYNSRISSGLIANFVTKTAIQSIENNETNFSMKSITDEIENKHFSWFFAYEQHLSSKISLLGEINYSFTSLFNAENIDTEENPITTIKPYMILAGFRYHL